MAAAEPSGSGGGSGSTTTDDTKIPPQTPSRRDSHTTTTSDTESTIASPSPFTRATTKSSKTNKKPTFAIDSVVNNDIPSSPQEQQQPNPFLAYARRVRSFTSPFQLTKSRYLLTFTDENVAKEWWALMRTEYPDTVRESSQLFSFKSDKVPDKARENPKFAQLKDRWSYRQLEDSDKAGSAKGKERGRGKEKDKGPRTGQKSTKQSTDDNDDDVNNNNNNVLDDTTPTGSPDLVRPALYASPLEDPFTPSKSEKTDLAQLTLTSDLIQKSMYQVRTDMEALLEGNTANARGMQKMAAGLDKLAQSVGALAATEQQAHDETLAVIRGSPSREAGDGARLRPLVDAEQSTTASDDISKLQADVALIASQLKPLLESQKATKKSVQKVQAALDNQAASQKALAEQLQSIQATNMRNQVLIKDLTQKQDARFDGLLASFERHATQTQGMLTTQQQSFDAMKKDLINAAAAQSSGNSSKCDHDIIPPPRKVNRKLVGYVYSRNGS